MNDTLQTKIAELVDFTTMTAKDLFRFIQEQAPEVLQQWVQWNLIQSYLWATVSFLYIIVFYFIGKKLHKKAKDDCDYENLNIAYLLLGGLGCVIFVIYFFIELTNIIQIHFAEKVWILENIKSLFTN
jgi:hypothetical protein